MSVFARGEEIAQNLRGYLHVGAMTVKGLVLGGKIFTSRLPPGARVAPGYAWLMMLEWLPLLVA